MAHRGESALGPPRASAAAGERTGAAPVSDDLPMASSAVHLVRAPFAAVVAALPHESDERVGAGSALVVLEAMKMEHEVLAEIDGVVRSLAVAVGDAVEEGDATAVSLRFRRFMVSSCSIAHLDQRFA